MNTGRNKYLPQKVLSEVKLIMVEQKIDSESKAILKMAELSVIGRRKINEDKNI